MKEEQVPALRRELLSILDAVHQTCVRNNIKYYLVAGTALGAVRHHGFIPWDSDIDIAMDREDYERFVTESDKLLDTPYYCANFRNTAPWYHPHALIFKRTTSICWNKEYYADKPDCPIYIDLFALDNVPDAIQERNQFEKKIKRMMYLMGRKECIIYTHNNFVQTSLKRLYANALDLVYPKNSYNDHFEQTIRTYDSIDCQEKGILTSPYSFAQECINKDIIGEPRLYPFEGREYYGYEHIDEYLTQLYGNYMELPPPEERKFHLELIDHIVCDD
ncbi:MAG: LicD family protein [Clostridia bacterium]|nr:LicD family protein [Clostridia bacterium]